jgi:hypothetical protein
VWEETHTVDIINGYYSAILGADDSGNPLDTSMLARSPLALEITVDDGDPMEPRHDLVSVPYAILATTSTNVDGGTVDATEIRVNGELVVDTGGAWVGETPSVDWTEINGVPVGFADDEDADTLLDLSCQDGEIAAWDAGLAEWVCALDGDENTQLTEAQVDAFADNNGYSTGAHTVDTNTQLSESEVDAFADNNGYASAAALAAIATSGDWADLGGVPLDLADGDDDSLASLSCLDGEIVVWDAVMLDWTCTTWVDANTQLSEGQVETFITNGAVDLASGTTLGGSTISTGAHTIDTDTDTQLSESTVETFITNGSLDLASGTTLGGSTISTGAHTTDTNTQLSEAQVDTMVSNNGYSTGSHTTDTNTQLSESTVETYVTNGAINLASGSTIGGSAPLTLSNLGTRIYKQTMTTTPPWPNVIGTVSCNSGDKVLGGGCAGGCAQVRISAPSGEGWYCRCTSTWTGSITITAICLDL